MVSFSSLVSRKDKFFITLAIGYVLQFFPFNQHKSVFP